MGLSLISCRKLKRYCCLPTTQTPGAKLAKNLSHLDFLCIFTFICFSIAVRNISTLFSGFISASVLFCNRTSTVTVRGFIYLFFFKMGSVLSSSGNGKVIVSLSLPFNLRASVLELYHKDLQPRLVFRGASLSRALGLFVLINKCM